VQVGDPYEEKRLIEACLELLDAGLVVGIQDLGGAGLACATSETASRGGMGMDVDITAIPRREAGMEPFEVMTSESQERMLAIVEPADLDQVLAICARWEVRAAMIGVVTPGPATGDTDGGRLRILDGFDGEVLCDIPAATLHEDAPLYHRPCVAPAAFDETTRAHGNTPMPASTDVAAELLAMLADARWVYSQYDHQLFLNTVETPGGDAAVLRLKHPATGADTGRGLALTTDGNHRWCAVDPRNGTALTVAESLLNLACVGARPLAVVNCLNFGNPENPEVMWQLSEAVDGMAEACLAFEVPVIGGNVSLYNESLGSSIDPTPVVGMLGIIDALNRRPPGVTLSDGGRLLLIGVTQSELSGSRWARERGHSGGTLPTLDPDHHLAVADVVRNLVAGGMLTGLHDVSTGGVGVALAEMAARSGLGVNAARIADAAELFSESPSRVVACVAPENLTAVSNVLETAGVPFARIGVAGGNSFSIKGLLDLPLAEVSGTYVNRIPDALGSGTAQD
jgi:phosphoribosylformylglycinamidine synthase